MQAVPNVRRYMKPTSLSFDPNMPVYEALDTLVAKRLAGVPVIDEEDRLVGFLTEKDCLRLLAVSHLYNMTGRRVGDIMSGIYQGLHPDMDILSASMVFLNCNFATLPVLEGDELVGSLTRQDILAAIQQFYREKGLDHKNNKAAQAAFNNPSSIEQLQLVVGLSNNEQLASVLARRFTDKPE